ncbi:ABC transporter permease [Candidatus Bathyarchaeota archaeon]|nr:ABC transporter permease [Candidatus Bathyarchaeota archaeon]
MSRTMGLARDVRVAWAICEKDIRQYYLTPPSLMFGLLFPASLFLSFVVGRNIPVSKAIPILVAQTLFFASSSIGPISIPLERRTQTFDRYLTAPVSLATVLIGKVFAGVIFGTLLSAIPVIAGVLLFGSGILDPGILLLSMLLSAFMFSAMGVMIASMPGQSPGQVLMPFNFIRIPLLFVSGVFIPVNQLPGWGQTISYLSPLTHTVELARYAFGSVSYFGIASNLAFLFLYCLVFLYVGIRFHIINQKKG